MGKQKICSLILFLSLFISLEADADTTRFSVVTAYPTPDGGPYFTVAGSATLSRLQWHAGTSFDFSYKPLKTNTQGVIDRLLVEHFYGAFGLADWLSLGVDMPIVWLNHFADPETAGSRPTNETDLGDICFQVKFRILDKTKYPVGLAIIPFITEPTGTETYFMGDDGVTGGGVFVLDGDIGNRVQLTLNIGLQGHKAIKWRNIDQNTISLLLGAGMSVKATEDLLFAVDARVKSSTNHFFNKRTDTPAEAIGGLKYKIGDSGVQLYAGGGAGIIREAGAPMFRGIVGFSYTRHP